jgi:hypothetical protein
VKRDCFAKPAFRSRFDFRNPPKRKEELYDTRGYREMEQQLFSMMREEITATGAQA